MARTLAIPFKRFEGFKVSPKDLIISEQENGRTFPYTPEDVMDLLQDLRSGRGIKQPIVVVPYKATDGQKLKVLAGYRRAYAGIIYQDENPDYLISCVLDEPESDKEALLINVRENVAKKTLSPIDLGSNAVRLREFGMSNKEIAQELGVSEAQISQHIKLVEELPERTQALVHKRALTADDAFNLLKIPGPQREGVIERILEDQGKLMVNRDISVDGESGPAQRAIVSNKSQAIKNAARESGATIPLKLVEFKKYLQEAIDEDGPGSNRGEVELKKELLDFLAGKITRKKMDNRFADYCKVRGA